ncbi:MAG: ABC transporter substrate-binding protein [Chloroflexi bacterium]|nr:ABC transporter substrate-binding protein [Chloroflexota bacterium]
MKASVLGAGMAACLWLAACGGTAAPVSSQPASSSAAASSNAATSVTQAASAPPSASGKPAAGLTRISVSYPEGGSHVPLFYAQDKGLFAKYGLDVDLQALGAGAAGVAALNKGDIKIADISGSTVAAADAGGADIVALATLDPVYPYVLEASGKIKTPQDLKGQGIAVRAVGDATDVAARIGIQKLGLRPDTDVKILAVNTPDARMAAVEAGQICCTLAQPQDQLELESKEGFHVLFDFTTLDAKNAQGVIATPRAYLQSNRLVVQGFMNGLVDAIAAEKNDRAGTVVEMKKMLKLDNDNTANVLYDYFVGKVIPANPVATADQFTDGIAILTATNPNMKGFAMDKYIDGSVLTETVNRK